MALATLLYAASIVQPGGNAMPAGRRAIPPPLDRPSSLGGWNGREVATDRRASGERVMPIAVPDVRPPVPDDSAAPRASGEGPLLDPAIRNQIRRSFGVPGNNLGDRLAEKIVTRLAGWPADRALRIVVRAANGMDETVRVYPARVPGGGQPVTLLLEDGIYIAIAEEGSPFGRGARMTAPVGETQRGDSFYIAVKQALYPGQRDAMGIERWDTVDATSLRRKVMAFANGRANRRVMTGLFKQCAKDAGWRMATLARRTTSITSTSAPVTASVSCVDGAWDVSVGPVEAKKWFLFNLFVHDDVTWGKDRIMRDRLQWWVDDVTALLPAGAGLKVRFLHGVKGVGDIDYKSSGKDHFAGLGRFASALSGRRFCGKAIESTDEFHLLLTGSNAHPEVRGSAQGNIGIASLVGHRTVGHELGHLIGATHEDGTGESVGPYRWCDSAMREANLYRRRNPDCGRFSAKNKSNIGSWFQARMPGVPGSQPK